MSEGPEDSLPIERLCAFARAQFGLEVGDRAGLDLQGILESRATASGAVDVDTYLTGLERGDTPSEVLLIASALTVGETYFFRGEEQFNAFVGHVVPELRPPGDPRPLRILSAGSSTGEEAYTVAILLSGRYGQSAARDASITGWDLDPRAIERAQAGRYSAWSLRQTSARDRAHWFEQQGNTYILDPDVRRMVSFRRQNLAGPLPLEAPGAAFDVIFCRNVLIYFSAEAARALLARLHETLVPGGYLLLGYAESVRGLSDDFDLVRTHGAFLYQRPVAGRRAAAPRPITDPVAAPSTPRLPVTPTLITPLDDDWLEVVRRSSARIAALASRPRPNDRERAPDGVASPSRAVTAPARSLRLDGCERRPLRIRRAWHC